MKVNFRIEDGYLVNFIDGYWQYIWYFCDDFKKVIFLSGLIREREFFFWVVVVLGLGFKVQSVGLISVFIWVCLVRQFLFIINNYFLIIVFFWWLSDIMWKIVC